MKKISAFLKKHWIIAIIIALIILLLPYLTIAIKGTDITFNQHYIESLDSHYNAADISDKIKKSFSFYTLGLNEMFDNSKIENVNFESEDQMFEYVFNNLPNYAIIYPTEMYYYYLFSTPEREISGNFRLVEIVNSKIGMGYFNRENVGESRHKMFGFEDGLRVKQMSENIYKVSYKGKTVFFHLNGIWKDAPKEISPLDEEKFISKVRDESGIIFYLIFNAKEKAFYYLLDEERPITDDLEVYEEEVLIGARTKFAYYYDKDNGRKILIGVSRENIRKNNYFDGPFDQVYPLMDIRDEIYAVYPYTQYGSGIDIYGNFLDRQSVRVAISPYLNYENKFQLSELVESCKTDSQTPSEMYSCITYEEKRDFHKDSPLFDDDGNLIKNATIL